MSLDVTTESIDIVNADDATGNDDTFPSQIFPYDPGKQFGCCNTMNECMTHRF